MNVLRNRIDAIRESANDETAAESTEVILVLVLMVLGLIAAWAFLRDKLFAQTERIGDCVENSSSATDC